MRVLRGGGIGMRVGGVGEVGQIKVKAVAGIQDHLEKKTLLSFVNMYKFNQSKISIGICLFPHVLINSSPFNVSFIMFVLVGQLIYIGNKEGKKSEVDILDV